MARFLFIVAQHGFRDEELFDTRAALEAAGHPTAMVSSTDDARGALLLQHHPQGIPGAPDPQLRCGGRAVRV